MQEIKAWSDFMSVTFLWSHRWAAAPALSLLFVFVLDCRMEVVGVFRGGRGHILGSGGVEWALSTGS